MPLMSFSLMCWALVGAAVLLRANCMFREWNNSARREHDRCTSAKCGLVSHL